MGADGLLPRPAEYRPGYDVAQLVLGSDGGGNKCYDQARENGKEIEQVVDKDALYQSIMAQVEETRQYWLDRLEKQGASTRTLEAVRNA